MRARLILLLLQVNVVAFQVVTFLTSPREMKRTLELLLVETRMNSNPAVLSLFTHYSVRN